MEFKCGRCWVNIHLKNPIYGIKILMSFGKKEVCINNLLKKGYVVSENGGRGRNDFGFCDFVVMSTQVNFN